MCIGKNTSQPASVESGRPLTRFCMQRAATPLKNAGIFEKRVGLWGGETQGDEDRDKEGTDDAVEHRQYHCLLVGVFQHHRKGGVLAGGSGGGDAGVVVELDGHHGDDDEGEDLPHQVAEKGHAAQFRTANLADGGARQAVPAHAAGNGRPLAQGKVEDGGAHQTAHQGAQNDAKGDDENSDVVLPDFSEEAPVHPHADAHGEHQQIEHQVGVLAEKGEQGQFQPGQAIG